MHTCSWEIVLDHAIAFKSIMELVDWLAPPIQVSSLAISGQFK